MGEEEEEEEEASAAKISRRLRRRKKKKTTSWKRGVDSIAIGECCNGLLPYRLGVWWK